MIPSHGFRHAAALLLTSSVRAIPLDATPETVSDALSRLAADLVGLADDMRMSPEAKDWLIGEYERTIARLPHSFDAGAARRNAADVLARAGTRESRREPRDLFLIYVPEDRLPVAAPLAIELTKRRVSVALSEFEVTTPEELAAAVEHGLDGVGG